MVFSIHVTKKISNIELHPDAPTSFKMECLATAKVYLHPMMGEHFGIAPAEALAAGLIPVVHTKSGTWTDICKEGLYGYGWSKPDPDIVAELVQNGIETWEKSKMASKEFLEEFSPRIFAKRVLEIVNKVIAK